MPKSAIASMPSATQMDHRVAAVKAPLPGVVHATAWVSLLTDMATELVYAVFPVFYSVTLGLNMLWLGLIEGAAEAVA
jgi:hypothetical protein